MFSNKRPDFPEGPSLKLSLEISLWDVCYAIRFRLKQLNVRFSHSLKRKNFFSHNWSYNEEERVKKGSITSADEDLISVEVKSTNKLFNNTNTWKLRMI